MALLILLLLVLDHQGYCLGDQKNETRLSGHLSTQLKSIDPSPSSILQTSSNGELIPPQDKRADLVISTTPEYGKSTSNSSNGNKHAATPSQRTTSPIPKIIVTTIKSRNEPRTTENTPSSKLPMQPEAKSKTLHSDPIAPSTIPSSSQKPASLATTDNDKNHGTESIPRQTIFPRTNVTRVTEAHTNRSAEHSSEEESSVEIEPPTSTSAKSPEELATSTPAKTSTEEEISTTEETSTLTFIETAEWYYSETNETTTENTNEDIFFQTTDVSSTDHTATDWTTDQKIEGSTAKGPSISNGLVSSETQPIPGVSLPLTKLILRLSKPGVFEKGKSVFEDDPSTVTTACPPGDVGLPCRRAEARRTADECSGGNCEVCRSCNNMAAIDWPHCCRENFRCCSELALACQQCDQPTLQVFCTKHFKRCF
ncbi:uncharacterized protein [Hetaerina americana]|uniref:uncharacterized protein n=1 Tax=Hetaerina americana TaxID=62018 RepID=UPI003A7F1DBA